MCGRSSSSRGFAVLPTSSHNNESLKTCSLHCTHTPATKHCANPLTLACAGHVHWVYLSAHVLFPPRRVLSHTRPCAHLCFKSTQNSICIQEVVTALVHALPVCMRVSASLVSSLPSAVWLCILEERGVSVAAAGSRIPCEDFSCGYQMIVHHFHG